MRRMLSYPARLARCAVFLLLTLPAPLLAQRTLHWDALNVTARLNADGSLAVTEEQVMVFTGDWNGGERTFNIRPRQSLGLESLSRWDGTSWQPLRESGSVDEVDTYALADGRTLRWRSRLPSDPPFERTSIRYQLRYTLSGILLLKDGRYTLDHDFAFPDRAGDIATFNVQLTLDPAWQPDGEFRGTYSATALVPGRGFVVTVPLRYTGSGAPAALDQSRPWSAAVAVLALVLLPLGWAARVLQSEHAKGRFEPLRIDGIDEAWLQQHILRHPAEIVSTAWDDTVGQPEVVTLLARLESEGKISSRADGDGLSMTLKVSRDSFTGYERALIDGLFFDGRTTTSTDEVKAHYRSTGFKPVTLIDVDLLKAAQAAFPLTAPTKFTHYETLTGLLGGLVLAWMADDINVVGMVALLIAGLMLAFFGSIHGTRVRARLDLGMSSAVLAVLVPLGAAALAALFIWVASGNGMLELSVTALASVVATVLGAVSGGIHSMRSLQTREGLAFRRMLTAGRAYMEAELRKPDPALRNQWYPWLLAFELQKEMDQWSVSHQSSTRRDRVRDDHSGSWSSGASSAPSWSGAGGGRSGGAGGGAAWAAAAGGLAAGVASPSSSGSGGSSSGGSSGGGGGGGW